MSTSSTPTQYISETPPDLNPEIKSFYERFYQLSDTPNSKESQQSYANDYFTEDADLVVGSKRGKGTQEIQAIRQSMWEHVAQRSHYPTKIFRFTNNEVDEEERVEHVMIYGTVNYVLKDGRKAEVEWAARAELVKEHVTASDTKQGSQWKMRFYQVYLDTAVAQNAK